MLPSELARDLRVDSTALTKRLQTYWFEAQAPREHHLSDLTVTRVTQAHELLNAGQAKNFKEAVQRVLGTYCAPITSAEASVIIQQLSQLTTEQRELTQKLNQLLMFVEGASVPSHENLT